MLPPSLAPTLLARCGAWCAEGMGVTPSCTMKLMRERFAQIAPNSRTDAVTSDTISRSFPHTRPHSKRCRKNFKQRAGTEEPAQEFFSQMAPFSQAGLLRTLDSLSCTLDKFCCCSLRFGVLFVAGLYLVNASLAFAGEHE